MPHVLNRHHFRGKPLPVDSLYVGRPSALGNPYTLAEHGPKALPLYEAWLRGKIAEGDAAVLAMLRKIGPETGLICSCAPKVCHADIIALVFDEWSGKGEDPEPAP